jgi:hypothetical protein
MRYKEFLEYLKNPHEKKENNTTKSLSGRRNQKMQPGLFETENLFEV